MISDYKANLGYKIPCLKKAQPIKTEQQQQQKLEVKKKPGRPSETVWMSLKELIWRV